MTLLIVERKKKSTLISLYIKPQIAFTFSPDSKNSLFRSCVESPGLIDFRLGANYLCFLNKKFGFYPPRLWWFLKAIP